MVTSETPTKQQKYIVSPSVSHQIWNYIGMLGLDKDTCRDLYQVAEDAIWEAATKRATSDCHSYLVQTGIGAIRHYCRDKLAMIRVPGYLHDRGLASQHFKTMVSLETGGRHGDGDRTELYEHPALGEEFEDATLEQISLQQHRSELVHMLKHLTKAERAVMTLLLSGKKTSEIARERGVRVSCIYSQQSRAIAKLRKLLDKGPIAPPARAQHGSRSQRVQRETLKAMLAIANENANGKPTAQVTHLIAKLQAYLKLKAYAVENRINKIRARYPVIIAAEGPNRRRVYIIHRKKIEQLLAKLPHENNP